MRCKIAVSLSRGKSGGIYEQARQPLIVNLTGRPPEARPPLPVGIPKAINAPMSPAEWTEAPHRAQGRQEISVL